MSEAKRDAYGSTVTDRLVNLVEREIEAYFPGEIPDEIRGRARRLARALARSTNHYTIDHWAWYARTPSPIIDLRDRLVSEFNLRKP